MSDSGDFVPEIIEGAVPAGVEKQDRLYVDKPFDEMPAPPTRPGQATGVPVEEFTPQMLRIMVNFDPRPLMEAVNEAVRSNDINKVIGVLQRGRVVAQAASKTLVQAKLIVGK